MKITEQRTKRYPADQPEISNDKKYLQPHEATFVIPHIKDIHNQEEIEDLLDTDEDRVMALQH